VVCAPSCATPDSAWIAWIATAGGKCNPNDAIVAHAVPMRRLMGDGGQAVTGTLAANA
jgi:hypothetical protein